MSTLWFRSGKVLAASVAAIGVLGAGVMWAPTATAQESTSVTGALWEISMPLAEPASNPGWVDMVGLGCEAGVDQAAWRVSVHSPHVRKLPYDMQTHFRAVIPAEAGRPVVRNVQTRTAEWDVDHLEGDGPYSDFGVEMLYTDRVRAFAEEEDYGGLDEFHQAIVERNPNSPIFNPLPMNFLGGYSWGPGDGFLQGSTGSETQVMLRASNGEFIRVIASRVDGTPEEPGDLTIYYHPVPTELLDSVQQPSDYTPTLFTGVPTNLDRVIHEVTIPADEVETFDVHQPLPEGTVSDIDIEAEMAKHYTAVAEVLGVEFNGELLMDYEGIFHGGTFLFKEPFDARAFERIHPGTPEEQLIDPDTGEPIDQEHFDWTVPVFIYTVEMMPDQQQFAERQDEIMEWIEANHPDAELTPGLMGEVARELGIPMYWVVEFPADQQIEFDIVVDKPEVDFTERPDPTDAAALTANYLPAQVYASEVCTRRENDLHWSCRSLTEDPDTPWGRGGTTENNPDPDFNGVTRGTLEITQLPENILTAPGFDPDAEYQRGVFGNPSCMVTRPTEDPNNYGALAGSVVPSDYDTRFLAAGHLWDGGTYGIRVPGQQTNGIAPENRFVADPARELYTAELDDMQEPRDGRHWLTEDACDQAAVALVCETEPETPPSTPTTEQPPAQTTFTPAPTPPAEQTPQAQPEGGLAQTGAAVTGVVTAAVIALVAGGALLAYRRRR